jgi:hypothetical protein
MRLRRTLLTFGVAALLLGDLAGCDMGGGPSAPSAPSGSDKVSGADVGSGTTAKLKKKEPGKRATGAPRSSAE